VEEIEKIRRDIGEFVEKLLSLVPPYDRISILSRECSFSKNFGEMSKVHSEFFHPDVFSIIQKLLGIRIESSGSIDFDYNGVGYYRQQDTKMIEILEILIDRSYKFKELKNELNRKGIILEEDDLKSYLRTLKRLGMIEYDYGYYCVVDIAKRHLKKVLR